MKHDFGITGEGCLIPSLFPEGNDVCPLLPNFHQRSNPTELLPNSFAVTLHVNTEKYTNLTTILCNPMQDDVTSSRTSRRILVECYHFEVTAYRARECCSSAVFGFLINFLGGGVTIVTVSLVLFTFYKGLEEAGMTLPNGYRVISPVRAC